MWGGGGGEIGLQLEDFVGFFSMQPSLFINFARIDSPPCAYFCMFIFINKIFPKCENRKSQLREKCFC